MLTVSVQSLRLLLRDAQRRGVDTAEALRQTGIDETQLSDPNARVPDAALRLLALHVLEQVDDPCWGLAVTADVEPGTFGTLGYVFRNSETLADSYGRVVRFARLVNEAARAELEIGSEHARLTVRVADPAPLPRAAARLRAQMWLSILVRVGRKITGVDFQPTRVAFPYPTPEELTRYRELFDCELTFDAPDPMLELPVEILKLPVVNPDRSLAGVMERYAQGLLEALPEHNEIALRVRQATCRAVEAGDPRLERVARELAMSARSLQRKLQAESISFSAVLDEVRRELALAYLDEPHLSVDQVASVLGFASGSSFAKAFRRWTGSAPGTYRSEPRPG